MEYLRFFLSSLGVFSGIIAGIIVILLSKEEQKNLQRYLKASRALILFLACVFLLAFLYDSNTTLFLVSLLAAFLLFLRSRIINHSVLGFFLAISSLNNNLFIIISTLFFLYWLIYAGINYNIKKKNYAVLILNGAIFLLVANLLSYTNLFI